MVPERQLSNSPQLLGHVLASLVDGFDLKDPLKFKILEFVREFSYLLVVGIPHVATDVEQFVIFNLDELACFSAEQQQLLPL